MAKEGTPQSRLAQAATVPVSILLASLGTLGWHRYRYVIAGDTPYNEVGIKVSLRLPEPLRV